jgi:TIR domain
LRPVPGAVPVQREAPMALFVSYARQDHDLVDSLRIDLERLGRDVWIDNKLRGGQEWWDEILRQIRACDVFVCTVSPSSIASKACRSELEYAAQLGRPILPVKIKDVNLQLAPHRIANAQVVDYTARTSSQAFQLAGDLASLPAAQELPEPLPESPPVPITYLDEFADELASPTPVTPERQRQTIGVLRPIAVDRSDAEGAVTAVALLQRLRMRPEITFESAQTIDEILTEYDGMRATNGQPPSAPPTGEPQVGGWERPEATPSSQPKRKKTIPLLVAGIVAALLAAGLAVFLLTNGGDKEPVAFGDDAHLDTLWTSCEDGDGNSCDTLVADSPVESEYADFGNTCGERIPSGYGCANLGDAESYGDHDYLDELWDACDGADRDSCTELGEISHDDTEYAAFATVCGTLIDSGASDGCSTIIAAQNIGDSTYMDDLATRCDGGDSASCQDLYLLSPEGSEYETFAQGCSDLIDQGITGCAAFGTATGYGDHPYLDGLWDGCAAGDGAACNELYDASNEGSDYETFGATCGLRNDPAPGECPDALVT